MFTGSFSVTQTQTTTEFVLTDTSSYSSEAKGTFSGRKIYLYNAAGESVVPEGTTTDYIDFPFGDGDVITIPVLQRDLALTIEVEWETLSPQPGSTYEATGLFGFVGNTKNFLVGIVQQVAAQQNIINNTDYYENMSKVQTEVDNCINAITYDDIGSAQAALDRAYQLIINSNYYF